MLIFSFFFLMISLSLDRNAKMSFLNMIHSGANPLSAMISFTYGFDEGFLYMYDHCTVCRNLVSGEVVDDVGTRTPLRKRFAGTLQVVEIALGHRF